MIFVVVLEGLVKQKEKPSQERKASKKREAWMWGLDVKIHADV